MKSYQPAALFGTVLATAALPLFLRAESNAPATPVEPVESQAADMQEIEHQVLRKQYDLALQELDDAEKAWTTAPTWEEMPIREQAYLKRAEWMDQLKAQMVAIDHVRNPKLAALSKKLDGVVHGPVSFEGKPIAEVLRFIERHIREVDESVSGVGVSVVLMDKDNQSPVTFSLENVSLRTVLEVAAEQAGLTVDIGEEIISLRKAKGSREEIAASLAVWPGHKPKVSDLMDLVHRARYPKIDFKGKPLDEAFPIIQLGLAESDLKARGIRAGIVLMDKGNESPVTFSMENVTFHTVLKVAAEQAGLTLDIGESTILLRKPAGKEAAPASNAVWPSNHPKVAALTKKLDTIRFPEAAFEDATINELVEFLRIRGKELDPDKTGVNLALMDEDNKSTVTFRLANATMHTILKIAAEQAGLALQIGEDVVSLHHPKDTEISEAATDKPEEEEKDAELAFYEKTYGKEIPGVRPKSKYAHSYEFYGAIAEQLGLREIISKAIDTKYGSGDEAVPELRTLSHVHPASPDKPGWNIVMNYRAPYTEQDKAASQRKLIIQKVHLDFEGNVTFADKIPAWEQAPAKPEDVDKDEELAFYEKTYGKKISHLVSPKSKYGNPDEFYADIADQLGLREIISKAADAKFGSKEENGGELRTLARVRPSEIATKPGWDIVMTCYTPKPKHENVDSANKVMVQLLHLDFEGNVTFLKRFPNSK